MSNQESELKSITGLSINMALLLSFLWCYSMYKELSLKNDFMLKRIEYIESGNQIACPAVVEESYVYPPEYDQ